MGWCWNLQCADLLPSFEYPDPLLAAWLVSAPCRKNSVLPGVCGRNQFRGFWSAEKDQVKPFPEIVGLDTTPNGGRDLKGCLAQWNGGKGHRSRRDQAYGLEE